MSRSNPIRWTNVAVNDGSGSASLGNAAAGFGRSAIQGLSILNDQMQDRINREDTLLTNEAIGAALNGGPTVSNNRRVDATMLQAAVEKQAAGLREERALESDLLTAVQGRANTALDMSKKQLDLDNYEEDKRLERERAQAEISWRNTQNREAEARMKEAERQLADRERIRKGRDGLNTYLYGPEIQQQADQEFQAFVQANPAEFAQATPAEMRTAQENFRQTYRSGLFRDPNKAQQLAVQFGMSPLELEEYTAFGRDAREARQAAQAEIAKQQVLEQKAQQTRVDDATAYAGGSRENLSYVNGEWTYSKSTTADEGIQATTMSNLGLDPTDDKTKAFMKALKSEFRSASAFEQAASQIVKNGKIPSGYQNEISTLVGQLEQRATDQASEVIQKFGTGDAQLDLENFRNALRTRIPKEPEAEDVKGAAGAMMTSPDEAGDLIASIEADPRNLTAEQATSSKNQMDLATQALRTIADELTLPDNFSTVFNQDVTNSQRDEIRSLHNAFQRAVKVAEGGAFLPESRPGDQGDMLQRPVKPTFQQRKEAAEDAVRMLGELQAALGQFEDDQQADEIRALLNE